MSVRFIALAAVAAASVVAAAPAALAQPSTSPRGGQAAQPVQRPVTFAAEIGQVSGALLLPLAAEGDLATRGAALSSAERAAITRALTSARFRYGPRDKLTLRGIGEWDQIVIVGMSGVDNAAEYQNTGAVAGRTLLSERGSLTVLAGGLSAEAVSELATGLGIGEYRSDLYSTAERHGIGPMTIVSDVSSEARNLFTTRGRALVDAMVWARDISNEPGNVHYPEVFVERARRAFAGIPGVTITVLDVPAMRQLGMGAILGVGQGSPRPPRMLIIRYRGQGAPSHGPVVLAGKGITFDSGGLSIKTNEGMADMEMDMSGAAAVTGAVLALARSRAPVDVVSIAALAENMPDGAAIRVSDVLTAMNGKTIEIGSTDAEGRLVLADALSYAEARLSPSVVVDVATLTGAIGTALGDDYAGMFTRHQSLADQLEAAGVATGDRVWHMPLHDSYAENTRSTLADIRNTGTGGGGAMSGAYFIGEFVSRDTPWAHLDIAGVAFGGANDWRPAGNAGFGVRLLERFVRDYQPIPRGPGDAGQ